MREGRGEGRRRGSRGRRGWGGEVNDLSQLRPFFVGHDLYPTPHPCRLWVYRNTGGSFTLSPVIVPVTELVPLLLFCHLSGLHHRAIGLSVAWAPAVAPLTEVVRAVSAEMPLPLTLQAATARGGIGRVRGGGVAFQVWLISGALAPCSITVDRHVKLLKIIDNALSCKAGVDEVGDKELFGVPDDVQDAMSNGSGNGGGDNGMEVEGGIITTSQVVLKYLLCFDGF